VRLAGCILRFDPVFGAADQEDQKEIDDAGICFHGKFIYDEQFSRSQCQSE
jgi:hypothetical protein